LDKPGAGKRAVIFTNGEVGSYAALRSILQPGDFLAAADGGTRHLLKLGLEPDLLVGDLDSLPPEAKRFLQRQDLNIILHPVKKDQTDLELALAWVLEQGFSTIRIAGAGGGRLDHTLGNLMLLTAPGLESVDIRLDDGLQEMAVIRTQAVFNGMPGDLLSLIPLEDSTGVSTAGLAYPLANENLYRHQGRGISNVFTTEEAYVKLEQGLLAALHTRLNPGESPNV